MIMELFKQYFDNQGEIKLYESKIRYYEEFCPEVPQGFQTKLDELNEIKKEYENLLSKIHDGADEIRIKFAQLLYRYIDELSYFNGKSYYPDLNCGLVIPKFLLSEIIEKLRYLLTVNGISSTPKILFSERSWNTDLLDSYLLKHGDILSDMRFDTFLDALSYYIELEEDMFENVWHGTEYDDGQDF